MPVPGGEFGPGERAHPPLPARAGDAGLGRDGAHAWAAFAPVTLAAHRRTLRLGEAVPTLSPSDAPQRASPAQAATQAVRRLSARDGRRCVSGRRTGHRRLRVQDPRRGDLLGDPEQAPSTRVWAPPALTARTEIGIDSRSRPLLVIRRVRRGAGRGPQHPGAGTRRSSRQPVRAADAPTVTAKQAAKFAQSLARGDPNRGKIALTMLGDKVRELL